MNLVIDVGNTRIKLAVFELNTLKELFVVTKKTLRKSLNNISKQYNINNAIIASVTEIPNELKNYIENISIVIHLDQKTNVPFLNRYETPDTLGVDRIALVAAAVTQFPNQNILVIDAGTCITYDIVSAENEYFGGAISPGLEMRLKALHKFTNKLPLLPLKDEEFSIGNNTKNSLYFGVINGVVAEIEGFIAYFEKENKKLTVVLTGGDTIFLAKRLKNSIFANSNFLLEGLNSILEYNLKFINE
ncbi:MAG: type III pantothenate kinase [Flavobacteriaceae bacterium]|nr:type III pantothenate kinase [Flavobacteriaceae bacterium]